MANKINLTLKLKQNLEEEMKKHYPHKRYRVVSKSLDARGAPKGREPRFHYIIEVFNKNEKLQASQDLEKLDLKLAQKPIIIGAGPAGLLCALRLVERGISCELFERGESAQKRMRKISEFWRYGKLDPDTNVCFGEGGAGLYSDGKLITRIKSEYIKYVMESLVKFGAPEEVAYLSNPHLGSNKMRGIIENLSAYLQEKGCIIHHNTKVEDILFDEKQKVAGIKLVSGEEILSSHIILAAGHSAKGLYEKLYEKKVGMQAKKFAIGTRIEHARKTIDRLQYGEFCSYAELGAARYRLSFHSQKTDRGSYSFCMCPGGYVLSSGSHKNSLVTNGMSNSGRNSAWSNSALVVSVDPEKDIKGEHPLRGLYFLEEIEKKAYDISQKLASGKELPALSVDEFLNDKLDHSRKLPKTSCPSKLVKASLDDILPNFVCEHLRVALKEFNKNIPGFLNKDAILIAPETRTSSPVTIMRDRQTLESVTHEGLYPTGEGAGYAGGITSAAVDGVRVAEAILKKIKN